MNMLTHVIGRNLSTSILTYFSTTYLDVITNVRAFGISDLWGDIGGYIGMVMGVSIVQVIAILCGSISKMVNMISIKDRGILDEEKMNE